MGTEEMGLPMTGAGPGEGGLLGTDGDTFVGLWGLGGTVGGGASLGLETLMLSVLLALGGEEVWLEGCVSALTGAGEGMGGVSEGAG